MSETPREPKLDDDDRDSEQESSEESDNDEVQEQSEESFPASDPPSF